MEKAKSYSTENRQLEIDSTIPFWIVIILLLGLTVAMFGDVLFTSKAIVLSNKGTDLFSQFIYWREFGFGQIQQGNLALWNPHLFSGTPYLGGFQSALLYPLNCLYLLLPLSKAINFSIALHVFLAGVFMYLWTLYRKLHPAACFLSSVLLMFCGAHFLHIYAGHLPNLCTMIWAPLIFLSIDGLFENRSFGWCLLGMFAIAMQILAGHPQYVFYTAVTAAIYSGFCIIKATQRTRIILSIIGMYAGALTLTAVQVLTGIQAAGESVRTGGVSYAFAAMFSFPPENFLTLLVPILFGDNASLAYWGRCYLWEMSLFLSATGFALAIYGAIYGKQNVRRFSITMILILSLLALGAYTPLFLVLYEWIPGFNMFRSTSKFIFYVSLFIILLAGIGMDRMIRSQRIPRRMIIVTMISGFFLGITALCLRYSVINNPQGIWQYIMHGVYARRESYLPAENYTDITFVQQAGLFASKGILIAAGTLLLVSILFFLRKFSHRIPYIIALIAIVEIVLFAKTSRPIFHLTLTQSPRMEMFRDKHPGDYRILYLANPNSTMSLRMSNIWGHDPGVLRRYAEFMTFTQGHNPNNPNQYLQISQFHPLLKMLRCRYVFVHDGNKMRITEVKDTMPRLQLIQDYLIAAERDHIFAIMEDPSFDPGKKVILETLPEPKPIKSENKATARILNSSTDHLTIEADLTHPAILLITDAYSKGWHAKALPGSIQKKYEVMPANYVLRAIPLAKGYHYFRLEYLPLTFQIGKWISIVSAITFVGLVGWYWQRIHKKAKRKREFCPVLSQKK